MSDFLDHLIAKSFDLGKIIQPRPVSLFEPTPMFHWPVLGDNLETQMADDAPTVHEPPPGPRPTVAPSVHRGPLVPPPISPPSVEHLGGGDPAPSIQTQHIARLSPQPRTPPPPAEPTPVTPSTPRPPAPMQPPAPQRPPASTVPAKPSPLLPPQPAPAPAAPTEEKTERPPSRWAAAAPGKPSQEISAKRVTTSQEHDAPGRRPTLEPLIQQTVIRETIQQVLRPTTNIAPKPLPTQREPAPPTAEAKRPSTKQEPTPLIVGPDNRPTLEPTPPAPVVAQPRVTPAPPLETPPALSKAPAPQPATTVHVTIGRVEVRAKSPAPPTPKRQRSQPPIMSLDEYLRQRANGGDR